MNSRPSVPSAGRASTTSTASSSVASGTRRAARFRMWRKRMACACFSAPLLSLSDAELEWVGDIDVLVLPVDDVKIVQHLLDVVDPRVFIPLVHKDDKAFQEVLKICGAVGKEAMDEFKSKGSLPAEGREVVILNAKK